MPLKVGILAFSRFTNYGSVLQVYALQETIKSLGYEAQVVDLWQIPNNKYALGVLHNPYVGIGTRLKGWKKWLTSPVFRAYEQRYPAFQAWSSRHLNFTARHWRTAQDFATNPPDLDVLEVGSDQVFNPNVSSLFLCTELTPKLPRFSYGASFGLMNKSGAELEKLRVGLSKYYRLSSREKAGVDLIKQLLNRDAPWVLDPTLLASRSIWQSLLTSPQSKEEFVAVYWIGSICAIWSRLVCLSKQLQLPIRLYVSQCADKHTPPPPQKAA